MGGTTTSSGGSFFDLLRGITPSDKPEPTPSAPSPEFNYSPISSVPEPQPLATFDASSMQAPASSSLATWKGMASGGAVDEALRLARGRVLEDYYPTQYLPEVGRQVMADGGSAMQEYDPAIVDLALMLLSRKT